MHKYCTDLGQVKHSTETILRFAHKNNSASEVFQIEREVLRLQWSY